MPLFLKILLSPKGWIILSIYGAIPLLIGLFLIYKKKTKSLLVTMGLGLVLSLSCFLTTPFFDDHVVNVSAWVEDAIPFSELIFIPFVLGLVYFFSTYRVRMNKTRK